MKWWAVHLTQVGESWKPKKTGFVRIVGTVEISSPSTAGGLIELPKMEPHWLQDHYWDPFQVEMNCSSSATVSAKRFEVHFRYWKPSPTQWHLWPLSFPTKQTAWS